MQMSASGQGNPTRATPEDLFLAWLLRLPHTADTAQAARIEIARLDRLETTCNTTHRFRIMLELASQVPAHVARSSRQRLSH